MIIHLLSRYVSGGKRLSVRLLLYVLFCSSVLAFFVTAIQVYLEYRRDIDNIYTNLDLVDQSYVEPVTASAYSLDYSQLNILLQGLSKIQGVSCAQVVETTAGIDNTVASHGAECHNAQEYREFTLDYPASILSGQGETFARLKVGVTLEGANQRLFDRVLIILLTNLVKTFLVSTLILLIFKQLVTRHLFQITGFTKDITLDNLQQPLQLKRKHRVSAKEGDELDQLVNSINAMQAKLASEIGERERMDLELKHQAAHDSLTGLINRREFRRLAGNLLKQSRQDGSQHGFCFFDLDQFKVVNDTCGHEAGDTLLKIISELLTMNVGSAGIVVRLGGDEFGLLIESCTIDQAKKQAEQVLHAIREFQFLYDGQVFNVGASAGLVMVNRHSTDVAQLLRDADSACYVAKESGRNRMHVYNEDDVELANRLSEMQWVSRINLCLEENRFQLRIQSIVPIKPDGLERRHYEILLRMIDETGKTILPGAFIPAAERYGLMIDIDCWVIDNTFAFMVGDHAGFSEEGTLSINLSGQSLGSDKVLERICSLMEKHAISGHRICFEITETAAISNLNAAKHFIKHLKRSGCRFALDDFGSGLSSFNYLKNLDIDFLKIDGSFVNGLASDPVDAGIVKCINDIGHILDLQTIAEYVETEADKAVLASIGVDYIQGFLVDQPQLIESMALQSLAYERL